MAFASFEYRGPVKVWGSCTGPRSDDRFELSIEFNLYVSARHFGVARERSSRARGNKRLVPAKSLRAYLYVWGTFSSVTRASGGCLGVKRR